MSNMLHIISAAVDYEVLFARIAEGDAILFVAGGVLSLYKNSQSAKLIKPYCQQFHFYALETDILARGLALEDVLSEIRMVDYPGFVSLTLEHKVIKTWN